MKFLQCHHIVEHTAKAEQHISLFAIFQGRWLFSLSCPLSSCRTYLLPSKILNMHATWFVILCAIFTIRAVLFPDRTEIFASICITSTNFLMLTFGYWFVRRRQGDTKYSRKTTENGISLSLGSVPVFCNEPPFFMSVAACKMASRFLSSTISQTVRGTPNNPA